ncbi:MAG TPA: M20/M25/M40 family metallo-hydrolase [Solirubrobacteraceae bacterium]|jgi:putative aminopeptidase FrvX|nr:M20/M25/M40 family metallo-hydrolase [Solirubrobacteraceae bacterium]
MPLPDVLRDLLTAAGPSGYETAPAAVFARAARTFTDDVEVDVMGSAVARVPGTAADGAPFLAVVGHIDEIGLIVTHIDDDGFLRFVGVGGWDPQILVGQRVQLITREGTVPGVVGRKPIHLLREDDRKKVVELRDLHIDIGAGDGDGAREVVRIGDVAVIAGEPLQLRDDRVVSRSMDNRLGAFIALEAARLVAEAGGAAGDVAAVGVVQEEITFGGARTSAFRLQPDVAIVVDVTHETGAPGVEVNEIGKHEFGAGPVIERGSVLNPAVYELLQATAEREDIAFTVQASARSTGTDADAIHLSRAGVPTGGVSIALRYMHSPVEMVQLSDIDACARLIAAFARSLSAETSFAR